MDAIGATCRRLTLSGELCTAEQISGLFTGLSSNKILQSLHINNLHLPPDFSHSPQSLLAALQRKTSVTTIIFSEMRIESGIDLVSLDDLVSALKSEDFSIEKLGIIGCTLSDDALTSVATCLANTNKTLRELIIHSQFILPLPDEFTSLLGSNATLHTLRLFDFSLTRLQFIQLFKSLEDNSCLKTLVLSAPTNFRADDVIGNVLDSLQANGILQNLTFPEGTFSSYSLAGIEAQLEQNRQGRLHREKLKAQTIETLPKTQAKSSRLFICGWPYAGKTILTKSLAAVGRSRKNWLSAVRYTFISRKVLLRRTRGIEITFLSKNDLQISMWDMAGQVEFHAFHDHMFPDFSNQASPSFFLFVWNPFKVDENGAESRDRKTREKFQSEFKYWLKFIASKTRSSKVLKPRLIVVITRKDFVPDGESIQTWLGDYLKNLQQSFKASIDIIERVFEVDARYPSSVKDLHSCIFYTANKMFSGVPHVYEVCEKVRTDLAKTRKISPLITVSDFTNLCVKLGIGSSDRDLPGAIALSLHDSGDLIYLKQMKFVVVDMHWFCHTVMGNLIYYSGPRNSGLQAEQGFFSSAHLSRLLKKELTSLSNDGMFSFNWRKRRTGETEVLGEDLVELLLGLHLACRKDDHRKDSEIFIPACLPSNDNLQRYWRQDSGDVYLGRRLKCRDSDLTFITPGVFHSVQVVLLNKNSEKNWAEPEKNSIRIIDAGVEVLVEFCIGGGEDHFIDVLVRSKLPFDKTLKTVRKDVIDEIFRVCAEPRGIQGVDLVEAVVRPSCVKDLSNVTVRRKQDVPIEDLHKQLEKEVQDGNPPELDTIQHSWRDASAAQSDSVIDILGQEEVRKWSESYNDKLHTAAQALGVLKDKGEEQVEGYSFKKTRSGKERELILNEVKEVKGEVREVKSQLREIAGAIAGLYKQMVPKLKELATFLKESDEGRRPRMPVVTQVKEGWGKRIISRIIPELDEVRLELLCEHRLEPHLVEEQQGLQFRTLGEGLLREALPFVNAFLKLAYVAIKVTAHVTVGLGDAIPKFGKVLAGVGDTAEIPWLPQLDLPSAREESRACQQWLFDVLSKHDCIQGPQIYNTFQLRRVRYDDSHVAWLCDKHYSNDIAYPL